MRRYWQILRMFRSVNAVGRVYVCYAEEVRACCEFMEDTLFAMDDSPVLLVARFDSDWFISLVRRRPF